MQFLDYPQIKVTFLLNLMADIANVIELVGSSDKSWEDVAQAEQNVIMNVIYS
jgi:hypothetical protein